MTQYLSEKIKVLSFIAIILVLYIHSGFHDYPHEILGMEFNHYLQDLISGQIGRCAVPLFFMISGYLFFYNINTLNDVISKIKKRVKSLLVPYIIAAIFFPLFLLLIEQIPFAAKMSNGGGFIFEFQKPIINVFKNLFIAKDGDSSPLAFHLWYLRDLIMIVACSPILFYLKKYLKGEILCLILFILSYIDTGIIQFSSFFWFMFGATFLKRIDKFNSLSWIVLYAIVLVIEMLFPNNFTHLKIPFTLVGIMGIWSMYDLIVKKSFSLKEHHYIETACSFTFFIYLFHEPTLNVVRKLLMLLLGRTSLGFAINYMVSPWIFAILFIVIGYLFKKYVTRLYSICVGGR